jgi:O-antigen/teichoic acid export membrane protein
LFRRRVRTALIWSGVQQWGTAAFSFAVFVVLARTLNPEAFGLIAMSVVFLAFLDSFVDQGLSSALVQRRDVQPEHCDAAFWTAMAFSVGLCIVTFLSAGAVSKFFGEAGLEAILKVLSISFLLSGLATTQAAILKRDLRFDALAIRSLVAVLIGGGVGIALAFAGAGVWSLVAMTLVRNAVAVVILWGASPWRPRFRFSFAHGRELYVFGVNVLGTNLLNFVNRHVDNLIIGYFLGAAALGYYAVGYRIVRLITGQFNSVVNAVAFPAFSMRQADPKALREGFYGITNFTSLASFPVFAGLGLVAPEFVSVFYGVGWDQSVQVMQILALAGLVQSVSFYQGSVLLAIGRPDLLLRLTALNAIVNSVLFLIAVQWGIAAVAAAYVVRLYLLTPVTLLALSRVADVSVARYLRNLRTAIAGTAGLVAVVLGLTILPLAGSDAVLLGIKAAAGCVAYCAIVVILDPAAIARAAVFAGLKQRPSIKGV